MRTCGFDVNGWNDTALRNWAVDDDGVDVATRHMIAGGADGVIVSTGPEASQNWVGGVQAALAPHGLGGGWGDVGKSWRRMRLRDCLHTNNEAALTAVLRGMSPGVDFGVLAIDDTPEVDDERQEFLLKAMRGAQIRTPLLVWRPVLAVLAAIDDGMFHEGARVGVVCHSSNGLTVQQLIIRSAQERGKTVLAPERRKSGRELRCNWGYEVLYQRAKALVDASSTARTKDHLQWAHSNGALALGREAKPEILRMRNGEWDILTPPDAILCDDLDVPDDLPVALQECDFVLFETLCDGALQQRLLAQILRISVCGVEPMAPNAIAKGALLAAERLSQRLPVYFDFLPQISTIVQTAGGAISHDLIEADAVLPAGKVYRSLNPARFAIQANEERFSIYLRKETAPFPRKAIVEIGLKLADDAPLELSVEQAPAAGRAKIAMQAASLGRQFHVDWETAEEVCQDWDDILSGFTKSKPTIPNRLTLPCGLRAWTNDAGGKNLLTLVEQNASRAEVDWDSLAKRMSARTEGQFAISSDGAVPEGLEASTLLALDRLTACALDWERRRWKGEVSGDNSALRFLTWQFRRCPEDVGRMLQGALAFEHRGHTLFSGASHWKLIYQGLGRIARSVTMEIEIIRGILKKPIDTWNWSRETAAMSFLLSRSDTAPKSLTRRDVDLLAKRVRAEFRDNLGTAYTTFFYAPFLLVGLLRWRLVEPYALTLGYDPEAEKLTSVISTTLKDLERREVAKKLQVYGPLLKQCLEELAGRGTNPELLRALFDA